MTAPVFTRRLHGRDGHQKRTRLLPAASRGLAGGSCSGRQLLPSARGRVLDLSFVRDLVRPLYAGGGRPSVDPVVFFKLQLVLFFEGLRSERELMRVAADRISVRW